MKRNKKISTEKISICLPQKRDVLSNDKKKILLSGEGYSLLAIILFMVPDLMNCIFNLSDIWFRIINLFCLGIGLSFVIFVIIKRKSNYIQYLLVFGLGYSFIYDLIETLKFIIE